MGDTMQQRLTQDLTQFLASLPEDDRIKAINESAWRSIRLALKWSTKLATELEFFQYRFSDSFGGNPRYIRAVLVR
ncbi:IbrB protein [Shigella flexneri]|nr:IbrB protein [Shigella flexneri]